MKISINLLDFVNEMNDFVIYTDGYVEIVQCHNDHSVVETLFYFLYSHCKHKFPDGFCSKTLKFCVEENCPYKHCVLVGDCEETFLK